MYIKYALKLKINRTFIEILSHLLYDRTDIFRRSQVAEALLQKKPSKPSAEKQRKRAVPFAWEAGGPARGSSSLMEREGPPSLDLECGRWRRGRICTIWRHRRILHTNTYMEYISAWPDGSASDGAGIDTEIR